MTNQIGPLTQQDLVAYVALMADAYPGLRIATDDDRESMRGRLSATYDDPSTTIYGLKHEGRLLAGMVLYDFEMNVRGQILPVGGLGSLAVDMLYRKRKAAKRMVAFYLEHYRQKGVPLAILYPFRTDFYLRMGFGYGAKMNRYLFRPLALRVGGTQQDHIRYLSSDDLDQLLECYDRYAIGTHGMIKGSRRQLGQMLSNPAIRTVGYVDGPQVLGYVSFDFDNRGHFLKNDLRVKQLLYQNSAVLQELMAFLRSLADQFDWMAINTQDRFFHYLLNDPRNRNGDLLPSVFHESNEQGVGLMYRVVDLGLLFNSLQDSQFGSLAVTIKISLDDSFVPDNNGSVVARFENGRVNLATSEAYDAVIHMDVSDFSSLLMGAINFEQLVAYGLASISDATLAGEIGELFATSSPPICMTAF